MGGAEEGSELRDLQAQGKTPPTEIDGTVYTVDQLLSHVGEGKYQLCLLVWCGLSYTAYSCQVILIGFLSTCAARDWGLVPAARSSISASYFVGQILGAATLGPVSDHWGRKPASILSSAFILVFGLLSAVSPNMWYLMCARMLVGFGIGGICVPADLLAEFSSTKRRGRNLLIIQLFWAVGAVCVVFLAWCILESRGWRALALLCALPMVVITIASLWMPESPRWHHVRGRPQAALQTLRVAAQVNGRKLPPDAKLSEAECLDGVEVHGFKNVGKLFMPRLRWLTVRLWILWFSWGFAYYGIILLNVRLFESDLWNEDTCAFNYESLAIVDSAEAVGILLALPLIDTVGRVGTQAVTYLLGAALLVPIAFEVSPQVLIVLIAFGTVACMLASSSTSCVHLLELYTTDVRGTGHAWANLPECLGGFLSPYLVQSDLSIFTCAMSISAVLVVAGVISLTFQETAGRDLDQTNDPPEAGPTTGEEAGGAAGKEEEPSQIRNLL